jgi:uncharacterized protein YndB with AHSA1/START domain
LESMEIDLSSRVLETPDQVWDALTELCHLPKWFGRNLDAWCDTLRGGITDAIDGTGVVVIRVVDNGIFSSKSGWARKFIDATEDEGHGKVVVTSSEGDSADRSN